MGVEVIALGGSLLVSVSAFGVFMWRVFVKMFEQFGAKIDQQFIRIDDRFQALNRRIDDRFETLDRRIDERIQPIEAKVDTLDAKVDGLAKDHQSLARELAEFRGEVRGRFGELSMPQPQAPGPT
ncbi:MAG: hypothetical protein J4F38_02565 [Pseudomonadales bacterium]|nr:hypothetical protein [Pseudomonadales bacterium]